MREYSDKLFDLLEEGAIDPVMVAQSLIYWCSEDDIKRWCEINEVFYEEDEDNEA